MATSKNGGKIIIMVLVALIGGATAFGYFTQASKKTDDAQAANTGALTPEQKKLLAPKPTDIILGDNNALVTIVEYSSLSCPHCAHFSETVIPVIEKNYITPGKVKMVLRHFPLNDPAIKGSELVECAGQNGLSRENFMKVLFQMQASWAFSEKPEKDLKQIASVGGIDNATFDSCMADKAIETRILTQRQEGETKLGVNATPTFYINGEKFTGEPSESGIKAALDEALKAAR